MLASETEFTLCPVILSGGSGSRLWPLSRNVYPKQFIPLTDEWSLFQAAVNRAVHLNGAAAPRVVCNQEHRFMTAEQLSAVGAKGTRILLESEGRNTAPAICVAALDAMAATPNAILLVMPADHLIRDDEAFQAAVATAFQAACAGHFVTFGIKPTKPETGYGYIRQGTALSGAKDENAIFNVAAFIEKPALARAEGFLAEGGYWWNSGMFMFPADRLMAVMEKHVPEIVSACQRAYTGAQSDLDFLRLEASALSACPSNSIDYAVMEKIDAAVMVPLHAGWNDVGSWSSLWEVDSRDMAGNASKGDVLSEDCHNCYFHSGHRLVTAIGIEDQIIVETPDAVLVASKDRAQDVRKLVDMLTANGREEAKVHRKVYRPWGAYEVIDASERFQVKRITVNPGHRLSLQMHHHRAEHWIIVSGSARVTRDDEVYLLGENESTFIPLGARHRLENPGKIPLELIEVQSGSYLGEDDIVRYEDIYGRSAEAVNGGHNGNGGSLANGRH
jgi:mannose-1-phosphate guanylyltransferase / mannose-6-phosphate isomerase